MGLGGWLWMLGGLILVIGIVFLVAAVITGLGVFADRRSEATAPEPIDILRQRFARGEITEAEFEQAKRALGYQ